MADSVMTFTQDNFEAEVLKSQGKVLVDFWAPWCGPCRKLTPVIEALADEAGDDVKIGKLNVDDAPQVAGQYGVRSVPTIIIFEGGEVVDKQVGVTDKQSLLSKLGQ